MKKEKQKSFSRMSAADKRVAIAKDVLAQIKSQRLQIETGVWADFGADQVTDNVCRLDQKALLSGKGEFKLPPCRACAIGAAYVSSIRLFNKAESEMEAEKHHADKQLKKFFSRKQIALIENAFEGGEGGYGSDDSMSQEERESAIEFGENHQCDEERATAIFTNIVKNNGTFKP